MKILQKPLSAKCRQIVKVNFSKPTKVKLLSHENFEKYKKGKTHQYRGGFYEASPVEFEIPYDGVWHAVIEKGSFNNPLEVTGTVDLLQPRLDSLNGNLQNETHAAYGKNFKYDDTLE